MPTPMVVELFKQLWLKPFTNKFPAKYVPKSVTVVVRKVLRGELELHPPIKLPPKFRGKLKYEADKCTGCGLCVKVCPSKAIELLPTEKAEIIKVKEKKKRRAKLAAPTKIKHYVSRCTFCAQCVDACPRKALDISDKWLLADTDKYSKNLVVK